MPRLQSRIAAGAVGEVWRAEDLVPGWPVAVKLLHEGHAGHPQTLARFRAGARHAGSLTHPGIAQVYDYGEAAPAGPPYLVLELVDGPSLAGVLAGGPLDPAAAMDVAAQVAAGLAAAHAAGLVHRDVKPANLLVSRDGRVKITDFGIADAAGSAPITQAGTLVGTPACLAPERTAGEPAAPASDLYSLGIVAYECLTVMPSWAYGRPARSARSGDRGAGRAVRSGGRLAAGRLATGWLAHGRMMDGTVRRRGVPPCRAAGKATAGRWPRRGGWIACWPRWCWPYPGGCWPGWSAAPATARGRD